MLGKVRIVLWSLVGLVAIGAIFFVMKAPDNRPQGSELAIQSIGGPFTLTGSDSQRFSSQQLAGRPYAIFFGFTHCPDVCPTTLARLVKLRNDLAKGDRSFEIVFVSVDPDRDGPEEVGAYSQLFDSPVIGLTGSSAAITQVKRQFGVFSEKTGDPDNYTVTHTATVFLMDRQGNFVSTVSPEENNATALKKLERLTLK